MPELPPEDRVILKALREDARRSNRDLAALTSLSHPAVAAHVRRLEEDGVIRGYTITVGASVDGLGLEARLRLNVAPAVRGEFLQEIGAEGAVRECLRITGTFSHELRVAVADSRALGTLVERLEERYGTVECSLIIRDEVPLRTALPD